MTGEPAFFEIGVADPERGRAFYGTLFGWTFEPGPSEGGGFAITTDGMPGGMHGDDAGTSPYLFFRVDDLDAAAAQVRDLGGTVEGLAEEDGDSEESAARFGRFTLCRDDQGSAFGLFEPPKGA
ncbi:VOC family protein [Streptomyces sp. NPDC050704]|uniref:VOC family protein n=1 Tax=Streptomyces sp. NPDC050704 TaxID=3157219 RepID=UPI0034444B85